MITTGLIYKEKDSYTVEVTEELRIGHQDNTSRRIYPHFETYNQANEWFYRLYPDGILRNKR